MGPSACLSKESFPSVELLPQIWRQKLRPRKRLQTVLAESVGEGGVGAVQARCPAFRLFPVLLPAQCGQIEQRVRAAESVSAAGEGGVGVEDLVTIARS